ncbi:hypothetical protein Fcan01_26361, partial [Folsomia candida]
NDTVAGNPTTEEVSSDTPQVQLIQLELDPRIDSLLIEFRRGIVEKSALEELENIETLLANETYYNQEVALLSRKGGQSVSKDVYDILKSMITNDLRTKIRYTAKSNKIPFASRLAANLLRDSVKAGNPGPSVKDSIINHHIGCWFRMKVISTENVDITTNAETSGGEMASTSTEADTDRFSPVSNTADNTIAGSNSQ